MSPPTLLGERFTALVEPLFARFAANEEENASLVAIREALLPKLLSGELRVKDAENFMGAAT